MLWLVTLSRGEHGARALDHLLCCQMAPTIRVDAVDLSGCDSSTSGELTFKSTFKVHI